MAKRKGLRFVFGNTVTESGLQPFKLFFVFLSVENIKTGLKPNKFS